MQNRDGTTRRADDTDTKMGSARMHLGKRAGFDTLHFLADSAALPWGPRVHAVPPNWGWRHSGGATLGTAHPHPSTKGGCGHRLYATWPAPRDGSCHQRAPVSRLAPHAPLVGTRVLLREGRGMMSLCTGFSMGEPAPPGRVLTLPQSEAWV